MIEMKKLIILLAVLIAGSWIFFGFYSYSRPKTGWIDLNTVFNEFIYKKELETKLNNVRLARKSKQDSLELELKILSQDLDKKKSVSEEEKKLFFNKRESFLLFKQQIEEDNAALSSQYDQQILKQLNQYVQDFGKSQGYSYIFGAEGNGSLMYADDSENITKKVSEYINNRYKGITE